MIPAHQPDLTLVDKTNNKVSLIDVLVPWASRAEQKEQEKKEINTKTYKLNLWDKPVEIVPIIIGALGTIPRSSKEESTRVRS